MPPLTISPVDLEIALSNFLSSEYASSYACAVPKSPSPNACDFLVENTSVKGDVYGEPRVTREFVTTDGDEISPPRLNAATTRDAMHTRTGD